MTDWHFKSASELAGAIRDRSVGSEELLDHFIGRYEAHNQGLNAVVFTDFEGARAKARAADAATAKGESLGPLHGLPVTIKDALEVAGMVTTGGAPEYANHVPQNSATAVARAEAAGAIVFGKTNLPFMSGDLQSYNDIYGTTVNPWNAERVPGGSSGGAAAAVAAGLTSFEIGSDIGGSIRTPSHFCGVYGHKPTWGIVPETGHIPGPPGTLSPADISVVGPLARAPEDLELLLDLIAGAENGDARGWSLALPGPRKSKVGDLKIAAWLDDPFSPIDDGYRVLLEAAADALEKAGAAVDRDARPGFTFAESHELYAQLLFGVLGMGFPPQVLAGMEEAAKALPPDDKSHFALQTRGATATHGTWLVLNEMRLRLGAAWEALFADYDLLLCPVAIVPAFPHDQQPDFHARVLRVNNIDRPYLDIIHWAGLTNVCGLPATVMPVGVTDEGLPVGVQIVGRRFDDKTTIEAAKLFTEVLGGFRPPPGY